MIKYDAVITQGPVDNKTLDRASKLGWILISSMLANKIIPGVGEIEHITFFAKHELTQNQQDQNV